MRVRRLASVLVLVALVVGVSTGIVNADGEVTHPLAVGPVLPASAIERDGNANRNGGVSLYYFQSIELSVPIFNQNDEAWKCDVMKVDNDYIGNCTGNLSIAAGCLLTSSTMVFKYYGDSTETPHTENICLGNFADPLWWDTAANSCSSGKAKYKGQYALSADPTVLPNLVSYGLALGKPPIVLAQSSSGSPHWFPVYKVDGDSTVTSSYWINDPWDGTKKRLSDYLATSGKSLSAYAIYNPSNCGQIGGPPC